jgi:hypothetical protein
MDADDELLAELRRVTRQADPPPEHVRAAAAAAFAFRDPDAALAALIGDSDLGEFELGESELGEFELGKFETVRTGEAADHVLSYDLGGARVDLEVTATGDGPVLTGQLLDAEPDDCGLETGDGDRLPVPVDEFGRFLLTEVPSGPARLHYRAAGGAPIVTPWFVL